MFDLVGFLVHDHRQCDSLYATLEAAVDADSAALECFEAFDAAMRRHLGIEEDIIFPAFEEATGMSGCGPTHVMRMEHSQMRALLDNMRESAAEANFESVLDHGDTLLMLIQQHNAKEEGMLYPACQQALAAQLDDLRAKLEET